VNEIAIGAVLGLFAGLVVGLAGGSGGLKVLILLLFGLEPQVAVATSKVGGIGNTFGSIARFFKTGDVVWRHVFVLAPISLVSSYLGVTLFLNVVPQDWLKMLIGVIILGMVAITFWKKEAGEIRQKRSRCAEIVGYTLSAFIGAFKSAFGSGIGTLGKINMIHSLGLTTIETAATRRWSGALSKFLVVWMFHQEGKVDWELGLGLLVGSTIGSFIGTHYMKRLGNVWAKRAFLIVTTVTAIMAILLIFLELVG